MRFKRGKPSNLLFAFACTSLLIIGILFFYRFARCSPQLSTSTIPKFSLKSLIGMDFNSKVDFLRHEDSKRTTNLLYLDTAKKPFFPSLLIEEFTNDLHTNLYGNTHSESKSSELSSDTIDDMRKFLLKRFKTNLSNYTVIFTYSGAQALKVIAESLPKANTSKFLYPLSANENILGLRGLAETRGWKTELIEGRTPDDKELSNELNVFAFPLVDEFSGEVYKDDEIEKIFEKKTITLVDASLYLQNHDIDLSKYPFDAVNIAFDRLFGFPQLGAIVASNKLLPKLKKPYFGGGTLVYALPGKDYEKLRLKPAEKFEDGSLPFLSIASLKAGFEFLEALNEKETHDHNRMMMNKLRNELKEIRHQNGSPKFRIYGDDSYEFVTFNFQNDKGELIPLTDIQKKAKEANITLSFGCHYTPGTCYKEFGITKEIFEEEIHNGAQKLANIGTIRASAGWMTTESDIKEFIQWASELDVEK